MNQSILKVQDVTRRYRSGASDVAALENVSLEIAPGEMVALSGPSGSGKSTLLFICAALDTLQSGRVEVCGEELHALSPEAAENVRRSKIGFVFQTANLIETLTTLENVAMPLLNCAMKRSERDEQALAALRDVGIEAEARRFPNQLSVGQKQRAGIARALIADPAVILADEPTASLDASNAKIVVDLLRQRTSERGSGVLIATHDPRVSERCDRTIILVDGKSST